MRLEDLRAARTVAMKNNDTQTKNVLSNMIDAVLKATITPKGRIEVTEQLVDETLIKYQKTIQEMIDTCPSSRPDLLNDYTAEMEIVKIYTPKLITDPEEIRKTINTVLEFEELDPTKMNKGQIMKFISPYVKGKADMKVVNQVVTEMIGK